MCFEHTARGKAKVGFERSTVDFNKAPPTLNINYFVAYPVDLVLLNVPFEIQCCLTASSVKWVRDFAANMEEN